MAVFTSYWISLKWSIRIRLLVQLDSSTKLLKYQFYKPEQVRITKRKLYSLGWTWLFLTSKVQQLLRDVTVVSINEVNWLDNF